MKNKCCYMFVLFAIVGSIVLFLLIQQNRSLKERISKKSRFPISKEMAHSLLFELEMKRNFFLKPLPFSIDDYKIHHLESQNENQFMGYVFMIFDMTVCGKCLNEELRILKSYESPLKGKNIGIIAIIGVVDQNEKSQIIALRQLGEIFFPVVYVKPDTIYHLFKLKKGQFLDSPFYVFTSPDFNVLDVYKAPYMKSKELEKWIISLINQRAY